MKSVISCSIFVALLIFLKIPNGNAQTKTGAPLRVAVAGMNHDHIAFFLRRKDTTDIILAGVYEPDRELALRYARQYHFDSSLIYTNLGKMLDAVRPEAVVAFGSVYDHLSVVEKCAPRGIHVMVEKPLATTVAAAKQMETLAKKYHIYLLTDYETAWYPGNAKAFQLIRDSNYVGTIRKVVIHDGHEGPKEIHVSKEFFSWLTDPVQNGAGALFDFGCYGANLMTWLMGDDKPLSVTAVTRQFKPKEYPKVDDDATIVVSYPGSECIIQASWNWPFGRKDIEIYGDKGYIINADGNTMRLRKYGMNEEQTRHITQDDVAVYTNPFNYLYDVIRGNIHVPRNGLYSLDNNTEVVKILSAARESAKAGKTVKL
ncbi:MAG TPA: Gfo/Idh/MocA family oxidoreductase [Chitinophagaceae bacterium]|nr:Gfo/Idh/MocA family oxidoreductase [Chitinophagaceae bacterium]